MEIRMYVFFNLFLQAVEIAKLSTVLNKFFLSPVLLFLQRDTMAAHP